MILHPTPNITNGMLKNPLHIRSHASMTQIPKEYGTNGRSTLTLTPSTFGIASIVIGHHGLFTVFFSEVTPGGGGIIVHGSGVGVFFAGLGCGGVGFFF
jgi:hypothetical protein